MATSIETYFVIETRASQSSEPGHSISYKTACAPGKDSDQPAHSRSLIRDFAVLMQMVWILDFQTNALRRFCPDCVDAHVDLILC